MWLIWKITIAVIMVTHTTQAVSLQCYNGSTTNFKEVTLANVANLLNTPFLPAGCELTVVIPGLEALYSDEISSLMSNSILQPVSNKCYCSLNWNSGITSGSDDLLGDLTNPAEAVKDILNPILGPDPVSIITAIVNDVFSALKVINNGGVGLANLRLIGFLEGSVVAGLIGQAVKDYFNVLIGQIVAMNSISIPLLPDLQKGAANLVVCIHTIFDLFSTDSASCDIDFFVNRGCDVQPGCTPSIIPINLDSCSSKRAIEIFAEAVAHSDILQGCKASSFSAWKLHSATSCSTETNSMGSNLNTSRHGSFYLWTGPNPPYGKGDQGCIASNSPCI